MPIALKNNLVILKGGKTAESCACCGGACRSRCTSLSSIQFTIQAPASSGMPWTDSSPILLNLPYETSQAYWPGMYAERKPFNFEDMSDTVTVPASLLSPSTPETMIPGQSGKVSARVSGCIASVALNQYSGPSLVYLDTYKAFSFITYSEFVVAEKGAPVTEYGSTEGRIGSAMFSLALSPEVSVLQYWIAADNAFFPYTKAYFNRKDWNSAATVANCTSYQSSFTFSEFTEGYLTSTRPGDEYTGLGLEYIGLNYSPGKQIRIAEDITITVTLS